MSDTKLTILEAPREYSSEQASAWAAGVRAAQALAAQPVIAPEFLGLPEVPTAEILEAIVKEFNAQETYWVWNPKAMYQRIIDAAKQGAKA
jgi:hypothetical protein